MAKGYKVLKIDELSRPGDAGGITQVYRHIIKTAKGVVLAVEVPRESFTPEKVAPILEAAAANADTIMAL